MSLTSIISSNIPQNTFVKPFPTSPHTPDHFSFEKQMLYTRNGEGGASIPQQKHQTAATTLRMVLGRTEKVNK